MRLLKFSDFMNEEFKSLKVINEIGDVENPYSYKKDPRKNNVEFYYFTTKNKRDYRVDVKFNGPVIVVDFSLIDEKGNQDWEIVTNDNDYRVFSTIFSIIKEIIKSDKSISYVQYDPIKNFEGDKRREKIYAYYIEKNYRNSFKKNFNVKSFNKYGEIVIVKIR